MPFKPIISINVDDEQFRDFVKIFDQYQSKLKDTDSEWSKAARTMNHGFGDRAGSKLRDMADTLSGMNPSIRGIGGGLIGLTRHMGVFGGAVSVAAAGVGLIGRGIKAALSDAIKLSLALAGGVSAFDRLAQGTVSRTNAARMLGTTTARASAFRSVSNAFGFNPNLPNSVSTGINPETFGTVQTLQPLTGMTPDEMQRHTIRAAQALRLAAHRWFQQNAHESKAWFQSQPIFQAFRDVGIGLPQGQQLANTPLQTILAMRQQFRATAAVAQLEPGAARDMATFRAQLGRAGIALETDLANHLHALGPHLGAFVDAVERDAATLINGVLTPANLKAVSGALDSFTKWAVHGGGRAAIKQFADALKTDVPRIATDLGKLASALGAIVDSPVVKWLDRHTQSPTKTADELRNPQGWKQAFPWLNPSNPSSVESRGRHAASAIAGDLRRTFTFSAQRAPNVVNLDRGALGKLAAQINTQLGIPGMTQSIAQVESNDNANAVNRRSGAQGLGQIMPYEDKALGITDPFNPMQSLRGEGRELTQNKRILHRLFPRADALHLAAMTAASYDWGIGSLLGSMRRHRLTPSDFLRDAPPETRVYVDRVMQADMSRLRAHADGEDSRALQAIAHNTRKPATRVVYAPQTPTQSDIAFQLFTASMGAQQ